jgi:gamma-polyglutamate biosynthesis protein CapA
MNSVKLLMVLALAGIAALIVLVYWPKAFPGGPAPAQVQEKSNTATSTVPVVTETPPPFAPVRILAFGDLLLDRYIKRAIDNNGRDYPLKNLREFLAGHDLVLANLEGSFTDSTPKPLDPNNAFFTFDPKLAPMLKEEGFNILNLANNHVIDFTKQGFAQSQAYLDAAGISHFGDYYNEGAPLAKDINGTRVAFVAYNEFGDAAVDKTVAKIKEIRPNADRVVVYTHWGIEYQTQFSDDQQAKARRLVDAGADVVLGGHPHVIQPIEIYNGKPIFYSLGNFLFDQIFSENVTHGLAVDITFNENSTEYNLYITEMNKMQVSLAPAAKTAAFLTKISQNSVVPEDIKAQILAGSMIIPK